MLIHYIILVMIKKLVNQELDRVTVKYSEKTTVIWKLDNDQYSRFIADGYAPNTDAVAHNFITRDGYMKIFYNLLQS